MSKVIKFIKSLVSSEPAATKVVSKATEGSNKTTATFTSPPSPSPSCSSTSSDFASAVHSLPLTTQVVKPHVPLIKFRKGGPASGHSSVGGPLTSGVVSGNAVVSRGIIEDYQLPARYQRTPIDEKEIDYINRGGPE